MYTSLSLVVCIGLRIFLLGTISCFLFWCISCLITLHDVYGHAPFRQSEEFEEQIGNAARERIGVERWTKRVIKAIAKYDQFLYYDHCFVGGGNAKHIKGLDLGPKVTRVSNKAGLLGGSRIWDLEAS